MRRHTNGERDGGSPHAAPEIDEFAYIVAHDLKEPLRGISTYCEALLDDYGEQFDADGAHRLTVVAGLADRLQKMISDLLTYCCIDGARPMTAQIDLNTTVNEVVEMLRPAIEGRNASVHVAGRLPTVVGNSTLIGMALSNLISNGLKFNESPCPQVEVGILRGDPPAIYVCDNGIGIDRRHHQVIFGMFRRLHSRKKYEGTGVGLTIVRKIVQWHGGKIWLESEPGKGSTFFLTFAPAVDRAAGEHKPSAPHWSRRSRTKKRRHSSAPAGRLRARKPLTATTRRRAAAATPAGP
jgi:light-regulated signal transduction histidine kinase (bacteriophytochrome)